MGKLRAFLIIAFLVIALILLKGYFFPAERELEKSVSLFLEPAFQTESKDAKTETEALIYDYELKQRIGQMIIVGFRGTEPEEDIKRTISDTNLGGVILFDFDVPSRTFPRNILNPEQVKELVGGLQKASSVPLFVAVDAEGGKVNRLKPDYGFLDIPSAQEITIENAGHYASALANQLVRLGINMNLAPVVDLNINPQNPIIGALGRSFSNNPEEVVSLASVFIDASSEKNIISVIKHFPGHGSSLQDSHISMVDVSATYKAQEMIPYKELSHEKGVGVMAGHIINRNIDPDFPAALSRIFITDILRKEIGFKGLVISDDIEMSALDNYGFEDSIIRAINAGCDIILAGNNFKEYRKDLAYIMQDIIFNAVKEEKIPISRIIESSDRIYSAKEPLR